MRASSRAGVLAGLLVACAASAAWSAAAATPSGRYRVTLRPLAEPIPLNTWHAWLLHVERADGAALALRDLAVDGGMPAHGHGLPSAPRLERGPSANDFVVQGLRFSMAGRWELRVMIADLEGSEVVAFPVEVGASSRPSLVARWSESERQILRSLSIDRLGPPPADPTNRVADDARAAALGRALFFARGLSGDGTLACASCHDPRRQFADGRARGHGVSDLERNTPSLVGAGWARWQFWDGRRDSLWSQALVPIEAAAEMHGTRLAVVRYVAAHHRREYTALFGALPRLGGLPEQASPVGDASAQRAWSTIAPARQEELSRAFANVGKAIAAYERRLRPGRSAFDRYVEAVLADDDRTAAALLSPSAVAGLKLFLSPDAQCARCHNGPLFTNGDFHNIGTASEDAQHLDFGRSIGIVAVLSTEFNCLGPFSDDRSHDCPELTFLNRHEENSVLVGAYKTPSLRNAASTAPYMHDGRFATLADVIEHYRNPSRAPDTLEFRPLFDMTRDQADSLVAFLRTLDAPPAAPAELLRAPTLPR